MPEYERPETPEAFEGNFKQIKPNLSESKARAESGRCLFCFDAPCIQVCPTGIDIPLFIKQINNGNLNGAAKTIYEANYLGNVCGKVCPTEVLCEGACVYNLKQEAPIKIGQLQSYATQSVLKSGRNLFRANEKNGKKVAIIGAGPAGLSCASELGKLGYEVDIFEAKAKPAGLVGTGIAPYKITDAEIMDEVTWLQKQFGFQIHYNCPISNEIKRLENEYHAVFLGPGLGKSKSPKIEGLHLTGCLSASEFIENLREIREKTIVPNHVIVIGGGNTAMDAANEAARLGAEVTLIYRRGKNDISAYPFEYKLAKESGVKTLFNLTPIEIIGRDFVEAIRFTNTYEIGEESILPCQMVIFATGQEASGQLLTSIAGLKTNEFGNVVVNPINGQTSNPKFFAGGDVANGGAEVVNAVAEGKKAGMGIHNWLISR